MSHVTRHTYDIHNAPCHVSCHTCVTHTNEMPHMCDVAYPSERVCMRVHVCIFTYTYQNYVYAYPHLHIHTHTYISGRYTNTCAHRKIYLNVYELKWALNTHIRALHTLHSPERALHTFKRAQHTCQRALHTCKRALNVRTRALHIRKKSPMHTQKSPIYMHKSPIFTQKGNKAKEK